MSADVSSRPGVGSAIDGLVDHGIYIGAEPAAIDPGRPCGGLSDYRPWQETARLNEQLHSTKLTTSPARL
jgi:hypothetical protein